MRGEHVAREGVIIAAGPERFAFSLAARFRRLPRLGIRTDYLSMREELEYASVAQVRLGDPR